MVIAICAFLLVPSTIFAEEVREEFTVEDRLEQIGDVVRQRLEPRFERQRAEYPPEKLILAAFKREKRLKLFAPGPSGSWRFVSQYPIVAASGELGPKLKEGDMQVPEGLYRVSYLNPMSKFWLSLGLNYPNEFDRGQAKREGRTGLGGEIMIHGYWFSEGCIAVGNTASEDLFVLAADMGIENIRVIIAPVDFREADLNEQPEPDWTGELYEVLEESLAELGTDGLSSSTQLIQYADARIPPKPAPSVIEHILDAFLAAARALAKE